jgi:hypothetical protein
LFQLERDDELAREVVDGREVDFVISAAERDFRDPFRVP